MRLSTKGRYGLRAMIDIALHEGEGRVHLREMAQRQEVSEKYLSQLVMQLQSAGLVRTLRGSGGGICLARPAKEITVREIMEALEGPFVPVDCVRQPQVCTRASDCATRALWTEMKQLVDDLLGSRTLADMCRLQSALGVLSRTPDESVAPRLRRGPTAPAASAV